MSNYRAKTLKEALRLCDVDPLLGAGLERDPVDLTLVRKTKTIEGGNTVLDFQDAGQFGTILFTGHRGCGKSTALQRIRRQWEQDYRVIYLEANEETDINDAEYTDLYLIVIKQVEFALRQMGLSFDARLLKDFEEWFKDVTKESERSIESSISIEGEASLGGNAPFIAKLLVKLLAQIKGADKQKTVIRQTLQRDISRFGEGLFDLIYRLTMIYRLTSRLNDASIPPDPMEPLGSDSAGVRAILPVLPTRL